MNKKEFDREILRKLKEASDNELPKVVEECAKLIKEFEKENGK